MDRYMDCGGRAWRMTLTLLTLRKIFSFTYIHMAKEGNPVKPQPETTILDQVRPDIFYKVDIVVIGAGQAGLSAAYHLKREGVEAGKGFVVLDDEFGPGGAWQHRWDSLTLSNVNGINDLPGMGFDRAVDTEDKELQANVALPKYYGQYEKTYELPIIRPIRVWEVTQRRDRFIIRTNGIQFSARGLINATGTWKTPHCPRYPGWEKFRGRQLHTGDYKSAQEFEGKHVIIVGGGISAVQMLGEVSRITRTTWVTRRPPDFREYEFNPDRGRQAVVLVEDRSEEHTSELQSR